MARAGLTSALFYVDPRAALTFLNAAFGFETAMLIEDGEGNLIHSEMRFGDSLIMIGPQFTGDHQSPRSVGGRNTQTVHIHIEGDADAHCARARAAGFDIVAEPETQFYGDRTYRCRDPEGHIWTVRVLGDDRSANRRPGHPRRSIPEHTGLAALGNAPGRR